VALALCARKCGDRLQCSLRTDPAPLGVFWGSAGLVLRSLRRLGGGVAFALCARKCGDRLQCSLRTDPAPLGVFWGSAGLVLRSLRRLGGGVAFALCARDSVVRLQGCLRLGFVVAGGGLGLLGSRRSDPERGASGGCCWGRCLARRRFGRINCATWRLLIVPRSGPGDLTRVLLLLARALARVLGRARVLRRCRRLIRRIGRRRGSG
jgi:hypothetical protein